MKIVDGQHQMTTKKLIDIYILNEQMNQFEGVAQRSALYKVLSSGS